MAAGLCAWLWRTPDALTALVAVLFALKLGWEHFMGALPFTAATLAMPVIHEAHTYGAIGGAAAALVAAVAAARGRSRRYNRGQHTRSGRRAASRGTPSMTLAFVFPGQGSQSVGMLAELGAAEPVVRATFAEASEVLGYDLWALCQDGPEADLGSTERTQPAMLAAGVATWRVWARPRRTAAGGDGGTQPRRVHRAGLLRRDGLQDGHRRRALPRPGDAAGRAAGAGRDGGDPRPR